MIIPPFESALKLTALWRIPRLLLLAGVLFSQNDETYHLQTTWDILKRDTDNLTTNNFDKWSNK